MSNHKAFALIAAVMIMVLFGALGVFGVSLLSTDIHISLDTLKSAEAFFLAEAGMQYALKHELSQDADWSDNSDIFNISMASGTFSIEYEEKTTYTAKIKFTGTKENITRCFTVNFKRDVPFNYAVYVGGNLHTQGADNLTIVGEQEEGATDFPTVNFSYYQSIADPGQVISGNKTFTAGTYSGIWYIDGNATVESNVTVNGSIIATGNITMKDNSNIVITADSPYPALVSNGNFIFQNSDSITVNGLIFVGADLTANFLVQRVSNINFTGTVIVAGNFNLTNSEDVTITYDESIIDNPPPGFPAGPGSSINLDTWREEG